MASADSQALVEAIQRHLFFSQAKSSSLATRHDHYRCLALAVRDRLLKNWVDTADTYTREGVRTATYLSAEYLLGPHLENNLVNLGLVDAAREACRTLGLDLEALIAEEPEPGLGNGGLGRLAACFQESMATLELPAKARQCAASSSLSVVTKTRATAGDARTRSNVRCIIDLPIKSAIILAGNLTEA